MFIYRTKFTNKLSVVKHHLFKFLEQIIKINYRIEILFVLHTLSNTYN